MMGTLMQNGMQGTMNCATGGGFMLGAQLVLVSVVLLAGAALIKYLLSTTRSGNAN